MKDPTQALTDTLLLMAAERFPSDIGSKDRFSCGFRHEAGVYVAELIREKVTDKLDHLEVELTLNVYGLDAQRTEKVKLKPRLPGEKRTKVATLPVRNLVATRTFLQDVEKGKDDV